MKRRLNQVKKFYPARMIEVGKIESWLSDMAKEGLHLIHMGRYRATFSIKEPEALAYRLEYLPTDKALYIQECKDAGWRFVDELACCSVFVAKEDENLIEIHTEPAEQYYLMRGLMKRHYIGYAVYTMCACLMACLVASQFLNETFWSVILDNWIFISESIVFLVFLKELVAVISTGFRVSRRLKAGIPIDHHERWKKTNYIRNGLLGLAIVILLYSCGVLGTRVYFTVKSSMEEDLVTDNSDRFVLSDIQTLNENREERVLHTTMNTAYTLGYGYEYSDVIQAKNEKKVYSFHTNEYHFYMEWLADLEFDQFLNEEITDHVDITRTSWNKGSLDELTVYQSGDERWIFARQGKDILNVEYDGAVTTKDLVAAVKNYLN